MITVCATAAFGQVAQVWRHTVITTHDHRVREGSSRAGHRDDSAHGDHPAALPGRDHGHMGVIGDPLTLIRP
jgi:hypothetical protein